MEKTNPKDMFVSRNSQQPIEASLSHLQQPIDILLAQAFGHKEGPLGLWVVFGHRKTQNQ